MSSGSFQGGSGAGEQFLAALVVSSDDAIIGLTPQGTVTSWNGGAERLFGYSAEEMLGCDTTLLVPPERRGELSNALARVRSGETVRNVVSERLRRDGTPLAVSITVSPVIGPDGALLGMSAIGRDMTAQVEAATQLRSSEQSAAEALSLLRTLQDSAPVGFGFVDREFRVRRLNQMFGTFGGFPADQQVGRPAAEVMSARWSQVGPLLRQVGDTGQAIVNTELSFEAPAGLGGLRHWLTSFYPVRTDAEIVGVGVVAVDITERKQAEEARMRLTRSAVGALASTVESRDPYTDGHQNRVATIASRIAAELGLDSGTVEGIEMAARIHDIGKIAIPAEILTDPRRLNTPSWELMKLHAATGADIVRGVEFPCPVADMVEQHHERLDGSGYPSRLRSDEILLGARVIAVADTVDAMTSHRPYRPAKKIDVALRELEEGRGRLFEPTVVDACLSLVREDRLDLEW
ncbi:MAG: HD domain-containing phosphohydrolase [Acidimicrobiales bacterium]